MARRVVYFHKCKNCDERVKCKDGSFCTISCFNNYQTKNSTRRKTNCAVCSKEFSQKASGTQKYCSHSCYVVKSRKYEKVKSCLQCKQDFTPCKDADFCSPQCWGLSRRVPERSCKNCSKTIERKSGYAMRIFCNKECYDDYQTTRVTVPCLVCSKELTHKVGRPMKYCSKKCEGEDRVGMKWSQDVKDKIRKTHVENHRSGKGKVPVRPQIDYDGVTLNSSYEVKLATRLDELRIPWESGKRLPWVDSEGKQRTYYPDFYLPEINVYLEPKSTWTLERKKDGKEQEKIDYIKENYKNVFFLWTPEACANFTPRELVG